MEGELKTVAVLGLGTMGSGMARRLLNAGFAVRVYNRSAARAEALAAAGARVSATPRKAASGADVVIAMLADDASSRSTWLGADGALAGMKPGAVAVESSTLSVTWVKELGAAAQSLGCGFLDAPVTGSKPQAETGELLFLVGGDGATLDSVRDTLAPMSRGAIHLGPVGSGAMMKLINNFVCGVQAAALAEAVAVIERSGLNPAQALDVLSNGAPGGPLVRALAGRMMTRDYRPNFALKLMEKDLRYAIAEAQRLGVSLETARASRSLFQTASDGWADHDLAAVVEPFRRAKKNSGG
jgi:3-hydroxyisobutyrate dehydrogenase